MVDCLVLVSDVLFCISNNGMMIRFYFHTFEITKQFLSAIRKRMTWWTWKGHFYLGRVGRRSSATSCCCCCWSCWCCWCWCWRWMAPWFVHFDAKPLLFPAAWKGLGTFSSYWEGLFLFSAAETWNCHQDGEWHIGEYVNIISMPCNAMHIYSLSLPDVSS